MKKLAIFASGNGTNAERIATYFAAHKTVIISLILTNNPKAGVLQRAKKLGIKSVVFNRKQFYDTEEVVEILIAHKIDLIVLAGFLWLVPDNLLKSYPNSILNIHPALLPKYGGKGMYGKHVHEAVISNEEKKSGISIHLVNEKYDEGQVIFQIELDVHKNDTPESLAARIHELEYEYYPEVIEEQLFKK